MPTIRLAEERDLPAITEIMKWATEETLATFTIHPRDVNSFRTKWEKTRAYYPWLVATDGEHVMGFAKAGPFRENDAYAHTAEVTVYLAPAHHRRGIGAKLYERLFALLHLQGYHHLVAVVTSANRDSIRFHERIGMRNVGTIEDCGWKFDRFLGITLLELRIQDAHQKPGQILTVAEVAPNL